MPSRETVVLLTESSEGEEEEEEEEEEEVIIIEEKKPNEKKEEIAVVQDNEITKPPPKKSPLPSNSNIQRTKATTTSTPATKSPKKKKHTQNKTTTPSTATNSTKKKKRSNSSSAKKSDSTKTPTKKPDGSKKSTPAKKSPVKTPTSSKQQPSIASFFSVSPKQTKPALSPALPTPQKDVITKSTTTPAPTHTPKAPTSTTSNPKPQTTPSSKSTKKRFSSTPTKDDMMAIVLGPMFNSTEEPATTTALSSNSPMSPGQGILPDIDGLSPNICVNEKPVRKTKSASKKSTSKKNESKQNASETKSAKKETKEEKREVCHSVKRKLDIELEQSQTVEKSVSGSNKKKRKKVTPVLVSTTNKVEKKEENVVMEVEKDDANENVVVDLTKEEIKMASAELVTDTNKESCKKGNSTKSGKNQGSKNKIASKENTKSDDTRDDAHEELSSSPNNRIDPPKEKVDTLDVKTTGAVAATKKDSGTITVSPKKKQTGSSKEKAESLDLKTPPLKKKKKKLDAAEETTKAGDTIAVSSNKTQKDVPVGKLSTDKNQSSTPASAAPTGDKTVIGSTEVSTKMREESPPEQAKTTTTTTTTTPTKVASTPSATIVHTPSSSSNNEFHGILSKHNVLKKRYIKREEELVDRAAESLEEETQERSLEFREKNLKELVEDVKKTAAAEIPSEEDTFPEYLVSSLAVLIQGSDDPLSSLANEAVARLSSLYKEDGVLKGVTFHSVMLKIKLLASRKQYLNPRKKSHAVVSTAKIDRFEDKDPHYMWRWELISLDLLPALYVPKVKKARAARRKLQSQHKAVLRLLSSLEDAETFFQAGDAGAGSDDSAKKDLILAKISNEEEKVLKFEREEEKTRLLNEVKLQKEKNKALKQREKQQEKERIEEEKRKEKAKREEEKRKEKAQREEEREKKKMEAAKEKEELKRKKEEERLGLKRKEQLEKQEKAKKQKARMLSFFSASPAKERLSTSSGAGIGSSSSSSPLSSPFKHTGSVLQKHEFDSDAFRSEIETSSSGDNSIDWRKQPPFRKLSRLGKSSRKRKTPTVSVSVYVTSVPENNGFLQQPYAEQRIIQVPNRYKFLSFHEDCRPPYRGTWSKPRSSTVTGRNPFGKDTTYLDYDVDSEAEWEEGDDEQGEDCDDDDIDDEEDKFDAEEGDTRVYNYQDGWLAQDDDLGFESEEDDDEETKALRRKKLEAANGGGGAASADPNGRYKPSHPLQNNICVIAPLKGGIPLTEINGCASDFASSINDVLEGINPQDAMDLMNSHKGHLLMPSFAPCLDAFPPADPPNNEEKSKSVAAADSKGNTNGTKVSSSQAMSKEDMKTFVKFVHGCALESKTKIVEEFRTTHPNVTKTRAQAQRKLDSIASKRRLEKGNGVVWEVKKEILESLGMEELLKLTATEQPTPQDEPTRAVSPGPGPDTGTTKKSKDSEKSPNKKRPVPGVSKASANLFASFLIKKRKISSK